MRAWPTVLLGDVIERITGGKNIEAGSGASPFRIMKVSAVTSGVFKPYEAKPAPDGHTPAPEHHVREADFLFSRANTIELVGAVAIAHNPPDGLLLPDKIWRIEWNCKRIYPQYAYYLLRSAELRRVLALIGSGTSGSMKNISQAKLVRVSVPLPPLDEQRRIVGLLDRSAEIRRRAHAACAKARAIIPALFLDFFGDPATNPKEWLVEPLGNHISLVGGGTPSKIRPELWDGNISWVSPKDMKPAIISDSEDKITEAAMTASPVRLVPPGNVLIVVRGMILAHTIPIRMNSIAVTLNQDMKALVPGPSLNATFLRWLLQSAHVHLLGKIRESAHGTKKLETAVLTTFPTMLPSMPLQTAFAEQAERLEHLARQLDAAAAKAEAMAAGLSAKVFDSSASPARRDAA